MELRPGAQPETKRDERSSYNKKKREREREDARKKKGREKNEGKTRGSEEFEIPTLAVVGFCTLASETLQSATVSFYSLAPRVQVCSG